MKKSSDSREGAVKVEGATLRYVVEGSGIPVLVIGSAIYYPRTFSSRLRESCRFAFADLRHFAENDNSIDSSRIGLGTYADDIEKIREALGFEQFVLVGHSHHGNLALEYAKRSSGSVSKLVLIGTPPCGVHRTIEVGCRYWEEHASTTRKVIASRNREALSAQRIASLPPEEAFVAEYVANGPKYWCNPAYDASPLWRGVPINLGVIEVFREFFTDYELSRNSAQLRTPLLIVMGRHDYVVPHWNCPRKVDSGPVVTEG